MKALGLKALTALLFLICFSPELAMPATCRYVQQNFGFDACTGPIDFVDVVFATVADAVECNAFCASGCNLAAGNYSRNVSCVITAR